MPYPYLVPCLLARGVARVPAAVDVLLALEDFCDGVLHGAGLLKVQEVLPVAEYLGLPATLFIVKNPSPIHSPIQSTSWTFSLMKEISALCHD